MSFLTFKVKSATSAFIIILFSQASFLVSAEESQNLRTTPESLHSVISDYAMNVQVSNNVISFEFAGVNLFCVWDANADRMRLLTPITKIKDLDAETLITLLKANYHTVLDARYAIGNDVLYSAFIHPLSSITKKEIESAVRQVANTALTFGTTYNSGELIFGADTKESELAPGEDKGESM